MPISIGTPFEEAVPDRRALVAKAADENFPVGGLLLDGTRRRLLLAIYGFARLVDDIGDEVEGDRGALLERVESELERGCGGEQPRHGAIAAVAEPIRTGALPLEPFRRLIEANRRDQRVNRYESFEELLGYCRLSAAPVGELVLHVFGAATAENIALSDRICAGLQITEHVQDVREDHARGRVYIPAADLRRCACAVADLGRPTPTPQLRELIRLEVSRARALLDDGAPLLRRLRGRARLAVAAYLGGGRAALEAIEAADFDVFSHTPRAGRLRRAKATLRSIGAR
jgi:squalene synthase HpnC